MAAQFQHTNSAHKQWLPLLIAGLLMLLTVTVWYTLSRQQNTQLQQVVTERINTVGVLIKQDLDYRVSALNRLAPRWAAANGTPRSTWEADVINYLVDQPGYQAIEWADPALVIRWIVPLEGNEAALDLDLTSRDEFRVAPEMARASGVTTFSQRRDLVQGGEGIVVYVPIHTRGEFGGLIIGVLRVKSWLDTVIATVPESDYALSISVNGEQVYQRSQPPDTAGKKWLQENQFELCGMPWQVELWPTPQRISIYSPRVVNLMLLVGLLLSILVAYATYMAQTARFRARQLQRQITAHRNADEALRKNHELREQRVRQRTAEISAYLESAPDAMLIVNDTGAVQVANAQATALFGYSQQQLQSMRVEALMPQRYRNRHVVQRARFFADSRARPMGRDMELYALAKNGNEIPIEASLSPVSFDGGDLVCASVRDITERKQAGEQLREASRQLRAEKEFSDKLIATQQGIIVVLDADYRITLCNPFFENLTGFRAAEVIGKDWFMQFVPADERDNVWAFLHKVVSTDSTESHTNAIVTRGAERRFVHWSVKSITDTEGDFIGVLKTGYDVTREQAAAELLHQAKEEAERANAAKSRFLATASHDLRQPLQSLNLLNSALRKSITDPKAQKMLTMQGESLTGMGELLNSLLDISRLEAGGVVPAFGPVDLNRIFTRMRADFEQQAAAKGIRLEVLPTDVTGHGDTELVAQMISNLVANAIRYTASGSVTLHASLRDKRLLIEVTDTGIGIAQEQLHRIFDEFHQVDRDPQQRNEGLGLGLAIVQRIATLLHTRVEVQSVYGSGSTFAFALDACAATAANANAAGNASRGNTNTNGVVLLLDDDPGVLESSQLLLEIEGYVVAAAQTPAAAYAHFERLETAPLLVITDYHLGGAESGIDVINRIRERAGANTPAILVTGDTSPSIESIEIDNVHLLNKPIKADALLARMRQLLGVLSR